MFKVNVRRVVAAGLGGTFVMTLFMLAAPFVGMPPMNIGKMLGSVMGGSDVLGWGAHFVIGTILAAFYAAFFVGRLPGPIAVRGMTYSLLPWLMAQVVVMPMMGMGFFSGSALVAGGSLVAHLVYGAAVGLIYGKIDVPSHAGKRPLVHA